CSPIDLPEALLVALALAAALETLHNMRLVHGALRPSNVMVLEDGRVKLMDLELAGLRDAQANEGLLAAEPPAEYLSPEQIRRAPATEKTDIYAFGVILYEMLCGVPPFQAPTRDAVLSKQLTETPTPMRRRRRAIPASVESARPGTHAGAPRPGRQPAAPRPPMPTRPPSSRRAPPAPARPPAAPPPLSPAPPAPSPLPSGPPSAVAPLWAKTYR